MVKRWTNEAEQDLKACFDLTDWTVFEAAATDLDELTEGLFTLCLTPGYRRSKHRF